MIKAELVKLLEPFADSAEVFIPTGRVLDRHAPLAHVQEFDPATGGIVLFADDVVE